MKVDHSDARPEMKEGKWYCSKCPGRRFISKRAVNIHLDWKKRRDQE